jgi:hypothetical protein
MSSISRRERRNQATEFLKSVADQSFPNSKKVYVPGKIHDIRVGMREITLSIPSSVVIKTILVMTKTLLYVFMTPRVSILTAPSISMSIKAYLGYLIAELRREVM